MRRVSWYANSASGYGDLVSPLCYSQNEGEIHDDVVNLVMRWHFEEHETTALTPDKIINYIFKKFKFPNVMLTHLYGCRPRPVDMNEPLKQIRSLSPFHNMYFPPDVVINPQHIVVCTPIDNIIPFEHNREWKNVMSDDQWLETVKKYNAIHLNYRVPVEETIDILLNCRFFIGYHGSSTWLARLLGLPMMVLTTGRGQQLTEFCFPWMIDEVNPEDGFKELEFIKEMRNRYIDTARSLQAVHRN